jgi:hypothetical protein
MTNAAIGTLVLAIVLVTVPFVPLAAQLVKTWLRVAAMVLCLAAMSFLVGCTAEAVTQPTVPLVTYTPAFEREAGRELHHCTQKNLCVMVQDYLQLRCALHWVKPCATLIPARR